MVTANGMLAIAAASAWLYARMIALARARSSRILCKLVAIIRGFASPRSICSLVRLSRWIRTTLIPALAFAT
jgi:hypothetical protein